MSLVAALALLVIGVLGLVLLDILLRRPVVGVWLVLGLELVNASVSSQVSSMEFLGFRVSVMDVGFSILVVAAVLRLTGISRTSPEQRSIVVFSAALLVSLVLGVAAGAIQEVLNGFRGFHGFLGSALYFSTVLPQLRTREAMMTPWFATGVGLLAIVSMRWVGRLTSSDLGVFDATFDTTIRVLSGPHTMLVATTALVLLLPGLDARLGRPRRERVLGIVLLLVSIVLNRRTVWLALAVAVIALLMLNRRTGKRVVVGVAAGLFLFLAALPLFAGDEPEEGVARPVTDTGTLAWRLEGWAGLLEEGPDDPAEYVIGQPFDSGYERVVGGRDLDSNPHSFYLQTFLRTGIVGLSALLAALALSLLGLIRSSRAEAAPFSSEHLIILLTMQMVWFLTWQAGAEQVIILGLAAGMATSQRRSGLHSRPTPRSAPTLERPLAAPFR